MKEIRIIPDNKDLADMEITFTPEPKILPTRYAEGYKPEPTVGTHRRFHGIPVISMEVE